MSFALSDGHVLTGFPMAIRCPHCNAAELVSVVDSDNSECPSCHTVFPATGIGSATADSTITTDQGPRLLAAKAIFTSALALDESERGEYVADRCGDDPLLVDLVQELLQGDSAATADAFLASPVGTAVFDVEPTRMGQQVGPYRIDGTLGQGAMGIVYRGVHEQLQRVVALKMIRSPGLSDSEFRRRFLTEAQAVARLQHPHIVQVFEVGESEGVPYLALELVSGGCLADRLENGPLPSREAAALVRDVATAIDAAHAAGVIHRDLKPANILLSSEGLPKVTDFGLAKQVDDPGLTRTGAIMGTPSYMAPEQAIGAGLEITTAADVYALGGVLYATMTGRPPFQAASLLETLEQVRGRSPVSPRALVPTLPRDLETITLKCLHKDPERRYGTAGELADDLDRFLKGEPIAAKPVSAFERTVKWIRRHPAPAALIATAILVPLLAAGAWSAYRENAFRVALEQERMASELRDRQQQEAALQTSMSEKLGLAIEEMQAHIQASRWPEALSAAERATSVAIEGVDSKLAASAAGFRDELMMIVELEQIWIQQTRVIPHESAFSYEESRFDYDALFRRHGFHPDVLTAQEAVADLGRLPATMREAVIVALEDWMFLLLPSGLDDTSKWVVETLLNGDPNEWRVTMRKAIITRNKQQMLAELDDPRAAAQNPQSLRLVGTILRITGYADRAYGLFRNSHARNPGNFWSNHSLAMLLVELDPPRHEEAVRYFASALALDPDNAGIMVNMAISHAKLGEFEQSAALFREAVRLEPEYAAAHFGLGRTLSSQGDRNAAIAAYQQAIEILPDYASAHHNLAIEFAAAGRQEAALASYDRAVEIEPENADHHNSRAVTLAALGRHAEAITGYQRALELAPTHPNATYNLARLYAFLSNHEQAEKYYRRMIELNPRGEASYYNLATMLSRIGRNEEAIELFREAVRLEPTHAEAWCNLSDALQDTGRFAEALSAIREGHRLGTAQPEWSYPSAEWVTEAEGLASLEARIEALLNDEDSFADTATQLRFAKLLGIKGRFADAARVYRDAFVAEPAFAEDLAAGHRYAAATAAAQAAKDTGEPQRSEFVNMARQWLAADLELRRKAAEVGTREDRQTVLSKLNFWRADERLTAIREEARLTSLPQSDQQACRQLWEEVQDTQLELEGNAGDGS